MSDCIECGKQITNDNKALYRTVQCTQENLVYLYCDNCHRSIHPDSYTDPYKQCNAKYFKPGDIILP